MNGVRAKLSGGCIPTAFRCSLDGQREIASGFTFDVREYSAAGYSFSGQYAYQANYLAPYWGNGDTPQFPLKLMSKDMDLVMDAARKSGADLPAASVAQSVLASNVSAIGELDLSAITASVIGQGLSADV